MNKKKLITLLVCAAVLVLGAVSVTMAYFTDEESATNTFTVGKVDISLMEYQVNEKNEITNSTDRGFEYKLIPGSTYSKRPIVTVEADSEPCWLFVAVDNQIADIEVSAEAGYTIEEQLADCFWLPLENCKVGKAQVYYRAQPVGPIENKAVGVLVFEEFTIGGDGVTNADIAAAKDLEIEITAYAVQAAGFDSAAAAWNATFGK